MTRSPERTAAVAAALAPMPAPDSWFGSDNQSGAAPEIVDAIAAANVGSAVAYGDDRWTREASGRFRELLGVEAEVLFVFGGTGANVVSLQALTPKYGAVICTDAAHINVDETGAPERIVGSKLLAVATPNGKLTPEAVREHVAVIGNPHHAQPAVVSLTQSTEIGTLYSAEEIAAITDVAHRHGLLVHVDGARIANAVAASGGDVCALTFDAGVDCISFGGTKNGMLFGEAVVFRSADVAPGVAYLRKQAAQLPSKMRFVAAQFACALTDGNWLRWAGHANAMAARLDDAVRGIDGVTIAAPTVVNSLFPELPAAVIAPFQAWCPHYTWNVARGQVRWLTSFATTPSDVDRFAAGVRAACAAALR